MYFFIVLETRSQKSRYHSLTTSRSLNVWIPFLASFSFWWPSYSLVCGGINPTVLVLSYLLSVSFPFPPHFPFLSQRVLSGFRTHPVKFYLKILDQIISTKTLFLQVSYINGFKALGCGAIFWG